jgi:hypothetical protein
MIVSCLWKVIPAFGALHYECLQHLGGLDIKDKPMFNKPAFICAVRLEKRPHISETKIAIAIIKSSWQASI